MLSEISLFRNREAGPTEIPSLGSTASVILHGSLAKVMLVCWAGMAHILNISGAHFSSHWRSRVFPSGGSAVLTALPIKLSRVLGSGFFDSRPWFSANSPAVQHAGRSRLSPARRPRSIQQPAFPSDCMDLERRAAPAQYLCRCSIGYRRGPMRPCPVRC